MTFDNVGERYWAIRQLMFVLGTGMMAVFLKHMGITDSCWERLKMSVKTSAILYANDSRFVKTGSF